MLGEQYRFNQNVEWERTRYLASVMLQTVAGKKKVKPTDLFTLPQDEAHKPKVVLSDKTKYNQVLERIERAEQKIKEGAK